MLSTLDQYLPHPVAIVFAAAIAALLVFAFIGAAAFLFIWGERKVSGRIQDRLGPTRVGKFGLLQSLADGIKLVTKEDFVPDGADKFLFRIAPFVAFCASFAGFIALPFSEGVVAQPLNVGAFFLLAVLSSEVFGVLLAGYSSANKWSLFGGVREAAQVVSYEIPRSLCVLVPVCIAGTLNLNTIAKQQEGFFWNWYLFHDPFTFVAFFVFFIVATASCKRAPFDLAEAESELVAGFLTEYSGMRWSYFFLAEYASMFAMSALASILFLGGWHSGVLPFEPVRVFGPIIGNLFDVGVFILKGSVLVVVMMWMRWSMPRLRIDQVMLTCLQYFVPISCVLLVGVCAWQLYIPSFAAEGVKFVLAIGSLALAVVVVLAASKLKPSPQISGAFTKP
jgi:NADH-quinone oxidoreductase subunit H